MSSYNFKNWKKRKMDRGEWLSDEEYKKKKKMDKDEVKLHSTLKKEFEDFYEKEVNKEECSNEAKINREIILDTETTGLCDFDCIVEISLLEMIDGVKTGRNYHKFLNPNRVISKKAMQIHRITNEKVKDCPLFKDIVEEIIKFIGSATIIAHNAKFDRRMLNNELKRCDWEEYSESRFIDTLEIARYLFPDEKNSQDHLCKRFEIDNWNRVTTGIHSAMEDTAHLYLIYKELTLLLKEKDLSPYDFKKKYNSKIE